MAEADEKISKVLEYLREAGFEAGEHPAPVRLNEYLDGLLSLPEKEEIQEHLALCHDCSQMVLELAGELAPEAAIEAEDSWNGRMNVLWPEMRPRLDPHLGPAAVRPPSLWRHYFALAALLLVVSAIAVAWALSVISDQRQLAEPQANIAVLDLIPLDAGGNSRDLRQAENASEGFPEVLLVLNLADLRPFLSYRAEMTDASTGKILWVSEQLRRSSRGNFTLRVSAEFLGASTKRIQLFGLDGERHELLARYEVDLDPGNR